MWLFQVVHQGWKNCHSFTSRAIQECQQPYSELFHQGLKTALAAAAAAAAVRLSSFLCVQCHKASDSPNFPQKFRRLQKQCIQLIQCVILLFKRCFSLEKNALLYHIHEDLYCFWSLWNSEYRNSDKNFLQHWALVFGVFHSFRRMLTSTRWFFYKSSTLIKFWMFLYVIGS